MTPAWGGITRRRRSGIHRATSKRFSTLKTTPLARPTIPRHADFLVQLRQTQHAVRTLLDADLAATGLTTPQYAVLAEIDRHGAISASDIAREFGMTAQTVNVLVKWLETSGLLRRSQHPTHGRILLASLTPAGRKSLMHGLEVALGVQDQLLSCVPASERPKLMRQLKAIEQASSAD
jgi:DNA-binding MarR family transcriptional regulator